MFDRAKESPGRDRASYREPARAAADHDETDPFPAKMEHTISAPPDVISSPYPTPRISTFRKSESRPIDSKFCLLM